MGVEPDVHPDVHPGVLAISWRDGSADAHGARQVLRRAGVLAADVHEGPGLVVATWGGLRLGADGAVMLARATRRHEADLHPEDVAALMSSGDTGALREMLPPFAAFDRTGVSEAVAVTDALGFRHLYHSHGAGWAAISTSARALAVLAGRGLDHEALTLQALLGWQVGQWTLFDGVTKLGPGELVRVRDGRLHIVTAPSPGARRLQLDEAVDEAADLMRRYLTAYVTDHPDATLQLTGGQDSRILLSAIPPDLRAGLTAITLAVPGSPDVDIAAKLSALTGVRHQVEALQDLDSMPADEAHALCARSSARLEGMADPLALAALSIAERRFDQGHRIAGLGGEVARGFYYLGRPRPVPVTRERVARLTSWRMFANEAIDLQALAPELREGARERAVDRVHGVMAASGKDWFEATDDFYLGQRMQRWAGVTDTAICLDRSVVNPMLDDRFIAIAQAMAPASKRGSLFLARLQMALDEQLGLVPLDGRPPPRAYAQPGLLNRVQSLQKQGRKAVAKARQRWGNDTRPPVGGTVLAGKVVEHWRARPELLDGGALHGVLDAHWVERMLDGELDAAPSTVAFILNVAGLPRTAEVGAPG